MKTYRGSPAAARHYVEADRGRADDYYLAEAAGVAERYSALPVAGVRRLESLAGDGYEAWIAGVDPETGQSKGRLRHDDRAVRFVEVTVNGPKSWSLAAELHPDISAAYDAAQDRAATQIIGWLAQHAMTRVGPRGAQVQVPVTEIEAVTVRHHTSRAGDPHRHLHLQVNARVLAEGQWRGLHTVGVRDSIDAINGIGHAAVATDPAFRGALAAHGFTLGDGSEIVELREFVGPFSARAAQIGRNIEAYETEWRAANPGREPSPTLRRSWDARAWADARPDKIVPCDGAELTTHWVGELRALGYRDQPRPVAVHASAIGWLDRDAAVTDVLSRLAARRSGWNAADIRGEVEQLIARANIVVDSSVRGELAEDLTARTVVDCVPLIDKLGTPEHIRALTSRHVLEVETDLTTRLAGRAEALSNSPVPDIGEATSGLDTRQREVVAALVGACQLIVIEGAAGAGKTTTLAAARTAIDAHGGRLRVVTPTLKAARVAAEQVGADASSAAWLAYQHGFRWDANNCWTRLEHGAPDPNSGVVFDGPSAAAVLRRGDLLLIDEAGMLDQDTARALLTIADEHQARVAMMGDRHQLPAVGRGGVLDLAARWVAPESCLILDTVHRFTRTELIGDGARVTVTDEDYARLSLAMRAATDPVAVFDALVDRDQIQVHPIDADRIAALAGDTTDALAAGNGSTVVLADTRDQVARLNAATRERLVATGRVNDSTATTTDDGQRIGVGDRVTTRRNETNIDVANRDTWTINRITHDGSLTVSGELGERILPAGYARQHVELAYAGTVHSMQGDTATTAHASIDEHSTAASVYAAMTRGRENNVAHLVAEDLDDARQQWVAAFSRDRADLGPAHAAHLAAQEADRYAWQRPLGVVLDELRHAWTVEADVQTRLHDARQRRDLLRDIVTISEQRDAVLPDLLRAYANARTTADSSAARLRKVEPVVAARAADLAATLKSEWDTQRQPAREAAHAVRHGAGRLGHRRAAVREAGEHLQHWARNWHPYLPAMPSDLDQVISFADWFDETPRHHAHFDAYARGAAEQSQPDYLSARQAAQDAQEQNSTAWGELRQTQQHYSMALQHYGTLGHVDDPADRLADVARVITADEAALASASRRIVTLRAEPTLRAQLAEVIDLAHSRWAADREHRAAWGSVQTEFDRGAGRALVPGDCRAAAVPKVGFHDRRSGLNR